MMNDFERNRAYFEAIKYAHQARNAKSIIDIGSGFGLLTLYALEVI